MLIRITNFNCVSRSLDNKYNYIHISDHDTPQSEKFNIDRMDILKPARNDTQDYKSGKITEEVYAKKFRKKLDKLNPNDVLTKIKNLSGDKIPVLICMCGMDKFCHRNIVKEWLESNIPNLDIRPYGREEYKAETLKLDSIDKYRDINDNISDEDVKKINDIISELVRLKKINKYHDMFDYTKQLMDNLDRLYGVPKEPTRVELAAELFEKLENTLPDVICRTDISELLDGLIARKTLSNLNSMGQGPNKYVMGNGRVFYLKKEFMTWLKDRIKIK